MATTFLTSNSNPQAGPKLPSPATIIQNNLHSSIVSLIKSNSEDCYSFGKVISGEKEEEEKSFIKRPSCGNKLFSSQF